MNAAFDFDALRRYPDLEADNLFAVDASDRLILDEAASALAAEAKLAVINDHYGALTLGAIATHDLSGVRVHQDALSGEQALRFNAKAEQLEARYENHALDKELLDGATLVLMQLPKSLDELDDFAASIARFASKDVVVFAGGRIKHMTPAMNDVFKRYFGRVDVSLARQKSRVLIVREPIADAAAPTIRTELHRDLALTLAATGSTFAGTKVDIGTRALLKVLAKAMPHAELAIDLGCGTGVLAAALASARPELRVIATDQSAAAVASATRTMELNGLSDRVSVVRDDGLDTQPDDSADLIVLNPPFHIGAVVHTGLALRLFEDAARVLRPGGELWTVFNSHLGYRQALARIVGPTELVTHNEKFMVTVSKVSNP
jgi:16S rRNA (guanine1207-N2)-methyltransferase